MVHWQRIQLPLLPLHHTSPTLSVHWVSSVSLPSYEACAPMQHRHKLCRFGESELVSAIWNGCHALTFLCLICCAHGRHQVGLSNCYIDRNPVVAVMRRVYLQLIGLEGDSGCCCPKGSEGSAAGTNEGQYCPFQRVLCWPCCWGGAASGLPTLSRHTVLPCSTWVA